MNLKSNEGGKGGRYEKSDFPLSYCQRLRKLHGDENETEKVKPELF